MTDDPGNQPPPAGNPRDVRCPACGAWAHLTRTDWFAIRNGARSTPPAPCPHDRRTDT
jgi:hypothetical protein